MECKHENWFVIEEGDSEYEGEERHICEDCNKDLFVIEGE